MAPNDTASRVSRRRFVVGAGTAGIAGFAGCTSDSVGDGGDGSDGGDSEFSGDIRVSGSSTVYPIATAVSELFQEQNQEVSFDISRDGSSGGFENVFVPGDSDVNNSSRPITDEEVQDCEDNGFTPVEFEIAQDALTVVVNNENDWVESLTYDQLERIWRPDDPAETWADLDDQWPDEPIDLYGPASTSGTFDYFTTEVLGEAGRVRNDFEGTEEDDQIATGVEGNEYALGYLPFAYYVNNPDETRALSIAESDADEATDPSLDAAATGEYPLARPLFFYANSDRIEEKAHLRGFIRFYIEQATNRELIADRIGYVPISDELAQEHREKLEQYS